MQNKAGAQIDRYKVIWDFGTATIELDSRYGGIDDGLIYLKSGGYAEEMKKTLEQMKSDREKI